MAKRDVRTRLSHLLRETDATRRFLDRGVSSMLLFGDAASSSNGFYERLGAERLLSKEGEFHGGYGWRDLRRLVDRPSDEGPASR